MNCGIHATTFEDMIYVDKYFKKRNRVVVTSSDLLIPISLQPDSVPLYHFKLSLSDHNRTLNLKYLKLNSFYIILLNPAFILFVLGSVKISILRSL